MIKEVRMKAEIPSDFKSSRLYTFYGKVKAQSFCGGGGAVWLHMERTTVWYPG